MDNEIVLLILTTLGLKEKKCGNFKEIFIFFMSSILLNKSPLTQANTPVTNQVNY